jgi:patatin-like phospholipase/acyl hydrolase
MSSYLILSCDGGGMRGYLSSLLLQRLNNDLGIFGANNQSINLYAGTSTGALIALSLAQGKSIDDVVNLYTNDARYIFTPLGWQGSCMLPSPTPVGGMSDVEELWQVLYDNIGTQSVRSVVENFIPGNPLLSSLANTVMIATFQLNAPQTTLQSWNPLVIDNFAGSPGANTYLYDAALSTSAAPVYFPPYYHPTFGWCSDGGLFANNPAPLAIARAINAGHSLSDIVMLSIGTGLTDAALPVDEKKRLCFGLKYWAWFETSGPTPPFPLLNGMMDGVSASNDWICGQLLGTHYMRVNPTLPKSIALDDYSPEAMTMMKDVVDKYFTSSEWTDIETWIKNTFSLES